VKVKGEADTATRGVCERPVQGLLLLRLAIHFTSKDKNLHKAVRARR